MIVIPQENLKNLKTYRYTSIDDSIMGRLVMQSYWNFVLDWFVPMRAHPNVITLTGFFILIASVLPLAINVVCYGVDAPWWGWVLLAVGTFLYQTLDALDGKQARRLGVGSSLGEMVDHGCDAVSTTIVQFGISCCACIPRTNSQEYGDFIIPPHVQNTLCSSMVVLCFYLAMWDQQRTGQFKLGPINGPTEGLLVSCAAFALRGLLPPNSFSTPIPYLGWTIGESFFMFTMMVSILTAATNISNVVSMRRSVWEVTGIFPMLFLFVLVNDAAISFPEYFSATYTPYRPYHHFILCFIFGMVCASAGTRLTIERLTKLSFKHRHVEAYTLLFCILGLLTASRRLLQTQQFGSPYGELLVQVEMWMMRLLVPCGVIAALEYACLCVRTWQIFGEFLNVRFACLPPPPRPTRASSSRKKKVA